MLLEGRPERVKYNDVNGFKTSGGNAVEKAVALGLVGVLAIPTVIAALVLDHNYVSVSAQVGNAKGRFRLGY